MGNIYDALIDLGYEDVEEYFDSSSADSTTGWDVDVDENGPFIVTDEVSTEIDLGRDVPTYEDWVLGHVGEPEYLGGR